MSVTSDVSSSVPIPGRGLLLTGIALAILSIVAYAIQFASGILSMPWYMPVATSLGLIMVVVAMMNGRSGGRWIVATLAFLLCAFSWALVIGTRAPSYAGPVAIGKPLPAFSTKLADGKAFSQADLAGAQASVLVFFRGRW